MDVCIFVVAPIHPAELSLVQVVAALATVSWLPLAAVVQGLAPGAKAPVVVVGSVSLPFGVVLVPLVLASGPLSSGVW